LFVHSFVCFCSTGDWTQSLQLLGMLEHASSPFAFSLFSDGVWS
jgi:hypothetical protein